MDKDLEIKNFTGSLGEYKFVKTDDGHYTLWSEFFDENCHSLSGAYHETIYNYIEGCSLAHKLEILESIQVLEIGLGMGIGVLATLEFYKNLKVGKPLHFVTTEKDKLLAEWVVGHQLIGDFDMQKTAYGYQGDYHQFHLEIWVGDALETIPKLPRKFFDAIYQDPFSPKKNPDLWSTSWFEQLKMVSKEDAILSTYSASQSIRKSMLLAGWSIKNRKGFGQKRSATLAFTQPEMGDIPLGESLRNNDKIKPV